MAEDVFGIVGSTQAGNFHVERVVAEGGFGVVYRAQHGAFRAPVALKCLKVPRSMTDEQQAAFLENFRSEAELMFRLSASIPEVVRPLHADALHLPDGRFVPFLALEWLDGEALDSIVARRRDNNQAPIGIHKLMRLLKPIAHALSRAHRFPGPSGPMAIVHRDLKPDNIFVARINGLDAVKILDFGIAKTKSAATSIAGRQTGEEALNAFTPAYAAPEQWLPKRFGSAGPWTDVWGLALTMVEVLSGRPPIEGELAAMMGTAIDEARRPTPRAEGVVVSPEIDAAFERALAVDPRNRTKDVETFWTELERAMGSSLSFSAHDPRREDDDPPPSHARTAVSPSGVPPPHSLSARSRASSGPRLAAGLASATPATPSSGRVPSSDPRAEPTTHRPSHPVRGTAGGIGGQSPSIMDERGAAATVLGAHGVELPDLDLPGPPGLAALAVQPTPVVVRTVDTPLGSTPPASPRVPVMSPVPLPPDSGSPMSRPPLSGAPVSAPRDLRPLDSSPPPRSGPSLDLAASPRSRPVVSVRMSEQLREASEQLAELSDLRERLRLPLVLLGVALVITAADVAMARFGGGPVTLGPARAWWVAAPLAVVGVALACWRVFMVRDDG